MRGRASSNALASSGRSLFAETVNYSMVCYIKFAPAFVPNKECAEMHHRKLQPALQKVFVRLLPLVLVAVACYCIASRAGSSNAAPLGLPAGFKAEVYATGLHTPRFVSFSPEGDLYVAE